MSTVLEHPPDSFEMPPFPVRRWTVAEYRHLGEIGVLTEEDRVELLEGWIVPKMTKGPAHEWAVTQLQRLLSDCVGEDWLLRMQCAINTADSEPEPDVSVVRAPNERYLKHHPTGPEDVQLVIEVADTTLNKDRRKAALYAADGLPTYIIVNLVDEQIEFHSEPDIEYRVYRNRRTLISGDLVPVVLDGQLLTEIPAEQFLPPES